MTPQAAGPTSLYPNCYLLGQEIISSGEERLRKIQSCGWQSEELGRRRAAQRNAKVSRQTCQDLLSQSTSLLLYQHAPLSLEHELDQGRFGEVRGYCSRFDTKGGRCIILQLHNNHVKSLKRNLQCQDELALWRFIFTDLDTYFGPQVAVSMRASLLLHYQSPLGWIKTFV